MDAQKQIFSLIAAAEDNQKAVQIAIDGMTAQILVLEKQHAAHARHQEDMQRAVVSTVEYAMSKSLAGASSAAVAALESASRPVVGSLSDAARAADEATGKLSGTVSSFSRKWALIAWGTTAGCILAVLFTVWGSVQWLEYRRESLSAEIDEMKTTVATLEKRGGKLKLTDCGGETCFQVKTPLWEGKGSTAGNSYAIPAKR